MGKYHPDERNLVSSSEKSSLEVFCFYSVFRAKVPFKNSSCSISRCPLGVVLLCF